MAGSYKHVVNEDGNLRGPRTLDGMLENGGDVFEAVEEMYGMIWYLAREIATAERGFVPPKKMVEEARKNYKQGLVFAKGVNGA